MDQTLKKKKSLIPHVILKKKKNHSNRNTAVSLLFRIKELLFLTFPYTHLLWLLFKDIIDFLILFNLAPQS